MDYLSACALTINEARYLPEYLEFHRLVGVERFFLYDNGSTDGSQEVLAPYVKSGIVVLYDWPLPYKDPSGRPAATIKAYEHCVREHGDEVRWIACLDAADEFLFSPTGKMLPDVLADYEQWPGVCVNHVNYGPSGHLERPEGLVIENYTQRAPIRPDMRVHYKAIVDPRRVQRSLGAHGFAYRDGFPVDENGCPLEFRDPVWVNPMSVERLRINHYPTRSIAELKSKQGKWAGGGQSSRRWGAPDPEAMAARYNVHDDALAAYAPAVREALQRRAADST